MAEVFSTKLTIKHNLFKSSLDYGHKKTEPMGMDSVFYGVMKCYLQYSAQLVFCMFPDLMNSSWKPNAALRQCGVWPPLPSFR